MAGRAGRSETLLRWGAGLLLLATLAVAGAALYVEYRYRAYLHTPAGAPFAPVALVFGAGLTGESPSPLLAERLDVAAALYRQHRVKSLLLSGNSAQYHDEAGVMRRYLRNAGVPDEALEVDREGLSTFESCLRARNAYGVRRALLVTQRFHLSRAVFIARSLGIDAAGVAADGDRPRATPYPWRELLARPLALERVWARWAAERTRR